MKPIANFFYELGMLKRQLHVGPTLAGALPVELDSLSDHTTRAALIGYILAGLEGVNSEKVACLLLVHDVPEIRIGDQHKVAARYLNADAAEQTAFEEQLALLPETVAASWKKYQAEFTQRDTKEGIVAKDADWLETAITARELVVRGYPAMQNWVDNVRAALETPNAKKILEEIEKTEPTDWWKDLKKMTYTKLDK